MKRIYRYPQSGKLAGVCEGVGVYYNIDPVLIRIIFLLLFLGFGCGLLVYIISWIIIPENKL